MTRAPDKQDGKAATSHLCSANFPCGSAQEAQELDETLAALLRNEYRGDFYALLSGWQRTLADNRKKSLWPSLHDKLLTLFKCGSAVPLDGPMVGIPLSIRDSDLFRRIAQDFGRERSALAGIEVMATAWNATFADTGLWMGKTFEPVTRTVLGQKCDEDPATLARYDAKVTRIGRNFFREPPDRNLIQPLGLPTLDAVWHLKDRPDSPDAQGFDGELLPENLAKERDIPYSRTGGIFLADLDRSVVHEMRGKRVYALNYRWHNLHPAYPMSCLIDEIVQIDDGLYLGQLVFSTRHFSLGALPFVPVDVELGEPYVPDDRDYGYQNNGFFLMMDPARAERIYAAFPQLRPRAGELAAPQLMRNENRRKFTTLLTGPSPRDDDGDVNLLLRENETVLQMLKRISQEISAQTAAEDRLARFEPLHRLFRAGIAPGVENGLFNGSGARGCNVRLEGAQQRDWYGQPEVCSGFDYYHGATLNLHCGFSDALIEARHALVAEAQLLPSLLAARLAEGDPDGPNLLDMVWHGIGKYIFPWAGKSFEKISPRKLSMLLDESADLAIRYPSRVDELRRHPASAPHYAALLRDAEDFWHCESGYAPHLSHSWDQGMSEEDREFWRQEADRRWVMGYNLQDARILALDTLMEFADINYRIPDPILQQASKASGSPFIRQGYAFLGAADRVSILPMNNGSNLKKRVFQFHYRYPLIGGPAPIGYCLDELVEIADGLFLGQLIYSTALNLTFHSGVDSEKYDYRLFGYFLLMDDEWERHRQAIGLDTLNLRLF